MEFLNKISLGKKITGSMVVLLLIMFIVIFISFIQARKTDNQLVVLANGVIPLSNMVANIDIVSLEQEIILEKILRIIEKEHRDFQQHALSVIKIKKSNNMLRYYESVDKLEDEMDELDENLNKVVTIISKLNMKEAEAVMLGELKLHHVSIYAKLACRATLEQFSKLDELNDNMAEILGFRKDLPKINIRVGLCTGDVIAGNIGSNKSKSYTVMGDTVNIAARLESANKQYGTRIMMNDTTYEMVKDEFETRKLDNIIVVGKQEPVTVYELIGEKNKIEPAVLELKDAYEKAFIHYEQMEWEDAISLFKQCLKINKADYPSKLFLARIKRFQEIPPPKDWNGVWRMTKK
ncbi:MAG: adenylate/guanylate cyclase domain-containing protein [Leptospirales bacterium]